MELRDSRWPAACTLLAGWRFQLGVPKLGTALYVVLYAVLSYLGCYTVLDLL